MPTKTSALPFRSIGDFVSGKKNLPGNAERGSSQVPVKLATLSTQLPAPP